MHTIVYTIEHWEDPCSLKWQWLRSWKVCARKRNAAQWVRCVIFIFLTVVHFVRWVFTSKFHLVGWLCCCGRSFVQQCENHSTKLSSFLVFGKWFDGKPHRWKYFGFLSELNAIRNGASDLAFGTTHDYSLSANLCGKFTRNR